MLLLRNLAVRGHYSIVLLGTSRALLVDPPARHTVGGVHFCVYSKAYCTTQKDVNCARVVWSRVVQNVPFTYNFCNI